LKRQIAIFTAESNLKNLSLRLHGTELLAATDQRLLHRIIGNLISNAIRYTRTGGVLVACRRHDGKHWVEVWDSGIGIADDEIELIFEEFRQLGDDSRNRGSGLGLAIVKKMAALLGLEIRVCSRVGHGSMFAIEIPVMAKLDVSEDSSAVVMSEKCVVALVDDNQTVLNALSLVLERAGYTVIAAVDQETLFERLEGKRPEVIISDYRLTKGDNGFKLIAAVRKQFGAELPAILITGDTDPTLMRSMQDSSISILYKPIEFNKLQTLIHFILKNRTL
jgi:CheY-like chemotaxis protein